MRVGYHASHEQFAPSQLLRHVRHAEAAGFQAAMCSDHFAPWSARQGHSGFAWAWLGAAMAATSLSFGTVNAPGQRYHPAIVAQAAATLEEMFPGRFWVALGSGELLNEHVTGAPWPPKPERDARMEECARILRALWAGETVTHRGLVAVDRAKLWTRPASPPLLLAAALGPETARRAGGWADGLLTIAQRRDWMKDVLDAFRAGGGRGKPVFVQAKVSWAPTDEDALREAHDQWRTNVFPGPVLEDLAMPEDYDALGERVAPERMHEFVRVSADPEFHVKALEEDRRLGVDAVYAHHVGRDQAGFIEAFGKRVLPALAG
jgi:probable non-F420 flavinoid oxidoreductase